MRVGLCEPLEPTTLVIEPVHAIRLSVVPSSIQVPDAVSTLSLRPVGCRLRSQRDPVRCPADPPPGVGTPAGIGAITSGLASSKAQRRIQPFQPTPTLARPL